MAGGNSTSAVAHATAARPGAKTPTGGVDRNHDHLKRARSERSKLGHRAHGGLGGQHGRHRRRVKRRKHHKLRHRHVTLTPSGFPGAPAPLAIPARPPPPSNSPPPAVATGI